jgi:outer membrane protein TolC
MKKLLTIIAVILTTVNASAQLTLQACIDSGLANRANIKAAKSETILAQLQTIDAHSKYYPQVALAYEYRYNPIIAAQIVPVGQFNAVPTDETRAIRFGTPWSQSAGLTVYQPIIDRAVKSRIAESQLNEKVKGIELDKATDDLVYEITKSYNRIVLLGHRVDETLADSARTAQSLGIINARFKEGRALKIDVNTATVNHNNNLLAWKKAVADWIEEKIYLQWLTNIRLTSILESGFAPLPETLFATTADPMAIQFDSLPGYQNFQAQDLLLQQKILTEKAKRNPTLGFQGFLAANQFSQQLNPFQANSWFGSSYVGLSVKLPLLATDRSINGGQQLQTQRLVNQQQQESFMAERRKELLQANNTIARLSEEIRYQEANAALLRENTSLLQSSLAAGQSSASDLNLQETDLQKLNSRLQQLREELNQAVLDRMKASGRIKAA